jgi:23S rRNA pseudouridine2605 synthase
MKPSRGKKSHSKKPSRTPKRPSEAAASSGASKKAQAGVRLNKYIANSGLCSRREADMHISLGTVRVNGKIVTEMGVKVLPGDRVQFDGQPVNPEKNIYVLLNKPKGFATLKEGERGQKTVADLVANATPFKIAPVGRLDRQFTGLLLFTNDVQMAKKLTAAKTRAQKIFHVVVNKNVSRKQLDDIQKGIEIDKKMVEPTEVRYVQGASKRELGVQIAVNDNRLVKRLLEHFQLEVITLDLVSFAGLTKKDLPRGHWRILNDQDLVGLNML